MIVVSFKKKNVILYVPQMLEGCEAGFSGALGSFFCCSYLYYLIFMQ